MIRRSAACLGLLYFNPLLGLGCTTNASRQDGGGASTGGATSGGTGGGSFSISTLVADGGSASQAIAISVAPDDRIGVAYFRRIDCADGTDNCPERTIQHFPDYEIDYLEVKAGQASVATKVQQVQLAYGLSVAFQPNGLAAVAYLGFDGASHSTSGVDGGQYDGTTAAWPQNDAVVAFQQSDGSWQQRTVMQQSSEAPANPPGEAGLDNNGTILGFWPALTFDAAQAYLAFRDGHFAQNACPIGQDWCAATIRFGQGGPVSWQKSWAVAGDAPPNMLEALGGHNQIVIFGGQPALAFDKMLDPGELSSGASDVLFAKRGSDGVTWTNPIRIFASSDTQSGPSMAVDSQVGLGVAAVDASLSSSKLAYLSSSDGITWSAPDPVVQTGTDGWFPSLAFDTALHVPHIVYYHCSDTAGINAPGNCPPSEDELRISHLDSANHWNVETVDAAGGYLPKIGFLSTGKRLVVYRASVSDPSIKLALEN